MVCLFWGAFWKGRCENLKEISLTFSSYNPFYHQRHSAKDFAKPSADVLRRALSFLCHYFSRGN